MKDDDIKRLRSLYPRLWRHDLTRLPDGWTAIIEKLMAALNEIQTPIKGQYGSPLFVLIQSSGGFAVAFASPNPELGNWTPEKSHAVIEALRQFNAATSESCEICGSPSVIVAQERDGGPQHRLCQRHNEEQLAKYEGRVLQ
ncbi:hypothetical protein [Neorhizobium sp. T6_25]|uniref:hypothetical protein n=1 Tax=Neorhizobium sp. T6_25 TaxID=2093833 RepID=UPI000CFA3DB0|nr:hypothetical protein [Neorhizobium sp. T6_25]